MMLPHHDQYPMGLREDELSNSCRTSQVDTLVSRSKDQYADKGYFPLPVSPSAVDTTTFNALPQPPPIPSLISATPTPSQDTLPDLAASIFKPSPGIEAELSLPLPPAPKIARNLRLPPFDSLGIASPHPDNYAGLFSPSASLGIGPPSQPSDPLHMRNQPFPGPFRARPSQIGDPSPSSEFDQVPPGHKAVFPFVITQTPPDDSGAIDWSSSDAKFAAGMEGQQSSSMDPSNVTPNIDATPGNASDTSSPMSSSGSGRIPWLSDALHVILDIVHRHNTSESVKILSHALPSPSVNGHVFPAVIDAIQQSTSSSSIMWMNVWHAVSGRFKFEDLPKSPPTTPAPPFEGDDYFTTRVFDYAVEVPDYSLRLAAKPLTPTQRPSIAPCSIDVSVVERYIPPTSITEFEELFSATGRSFLNDRLIELSQNHGTLLFIYPTKIGGASFKRAYLDPILDPTLRSMMISHGLPVNLVTDVATMSAINQLLPFEEMESRFKQFLTTLNNSGSPHDRYHRRKAEYTLVYASTQDARVDRSVWANDWWNKQEKTRIQRAFENNDFQGATMMRQSQAAEASAQLATATLETQQARDESRLLHRAQTQSFLRDAERSRGQKQPGDNEQMILQLMRQVATKPYKNGSPAQGIEVGVFVVQKREKVAVASSLS